MTRSQSISASRCRHAGCDCQRYVKNVVRGSCGTCGHDHKDHREPTRSQEIGEPAQPQRLFTARIQQLEAALHEGRRAIGDHFAPNDCYATGPLTGDPIRDLVRCPACSFIAMYDALFAKAGGE